VTPKVSVVIYNYNYARYLRGAIDCALDQTFKDLDVVVLDNGSTDTSPDILREAAKDPRVKVLLKPDNSLMASRFYEAIPLCQGDFVAILYADDYFLPERIERQVACFEGLGPDYGVVYSPYWRENVATGERWLMPVLGLSGSIFKDFLLHFHTRGYINPVSALIRRACLERHPFLADAYWEGEGYFLRLAMHCKFQYLGEPLAVMRDHATNLGKAIRHNAPDVVRYLKRLEADPSFPEDARQALRIMRGRKFRDYGWQGIRMLADGAWARDYLMLAIRSDPRQLLHPRTLAGLLLSGLPSPWLDRLNSLANRIVHHREVIAVAETKPAR
jgi:glycosyltransferase involved in cell wall biosynthesis